MPHAAPPAPEPGDRPKGELRRGWTTGTCATGAAASAMAALAGLGFPDPVTVRLPRGGTALLPLAERALGDGWAAAAIVKDAGDDPDVTHGCLVRARVELLPPGRGIRFAAGEGVGRVTRAGLPIPPGEPAINPTPRAMIQAALQAIATDRGMPTDLLVTLSIPDGERLAAKTLNGRLGILGGLSILGTTGVVVPYSCAAWVHSIHRGIDVARAAGLREVAAATGSGSERLAQQLLGLPDMALIEMGDFVGATLTYLRRHPLPQLVLAGGFAKLAKLAQGAMDLHSARSRLDTVHLADLVRTLGGTPPPEDEPTGMAFLAAAQAQGLQLADAVAAQARLAALARLDGAPIAVEVIIADRTGRLAGRAGG